MFNLIFSDLTTPLLIEQLIKQPRPQFEINSSAVCECKIFLTPLLCIFISVRAALQPGNLYQDKCRRHPALSSRSLVFAYRELVTTVEQILWDYCLFVYFSPVILTMGKQDEENQRFAFTLVFLCMCNIHSRVVTCIFGLSHLSVCVCLLLYSSDPECVDISKLRRTVRPTWRLLKTVLLGPEIIGALLNDGGGSSRRCRAAERGRESEEFYCYSLWEAPRQKARLQGCRCQGAER